MELLTAAQMREIENDAMESGAVTGLELMERAGSGVVAAIEAEWPDLAASPGRAVVLCGPGNNGGDGYVIARLLNAKGWRVEVLAFCGAAPGTPDARANHDRWIEVGEVEPLAEAGFARRIRDAALCVDALFGTGLARPFDALEGVREAMADAAMGLYDRGPRVVCVDIPSGLCADSGRYLGLDREAVEQAAIRGHLTAAFHRPKAGHHLADGPWASGALRVVDIGLPPPGPVAEGRFLFEGPGSWAARRIASKSGHKYDSGHVLVAAGGLGKGGAARLAARGALRVGAGLVTVGAPPEAMAENASRLDAVMLREVEGAKGLEAALADRRIGTLVLGPGLGVGPGTKEMVRAALAVDRIKAVLDADALTAFADEPEALFASTADKSVVLTPHMGEFARLFPDISEKLNAPAVEGPAYSRAEAAAAAADRARCVVLLKGPDTIVADPPPRGVVRKSGWGVRVISAAYERSCPWLATAGAGDVLAGVIAGLLARGLPPEVAAECGAWLHQECASVFGPGLIAEDLPEMLPVVLRNLNAGGRFRRV